MNLAADRPWSLFLLVLTLAYFLALSMALVWIRLAPEYVLALTLGAIVLAIMAFRPYVAVQVFILVLFFEEAVFKIGEITLMKALGVIILAGWSASILMQRRIGVRRSGLLIAILLLLAWAGLCVPGAIDARIGLEQFVSLALLVLSAVMFSSVVRTPEQLRGVLVGFVAWTVVATLIAIGMYYAGATVVAVGLVGNRNLLGVYINLAVACALLLLPTIRSRPVQLALALSLPILLFGLALTLSRTSILVMAPALLFVWYRLLRQRGFVVVLCSAITLAGLVLVLPQIFWQRTETIVPSIERRQDTWGLRLRIWTVGMRMIRDRPITGVGPGNFVPASPRYARGEILGMRIAAHNVFVAVAAELGVVGLGAFLAVATLGVASARRAFRRARDLGDEMMALGASAVELMLWILLLHGVTATLISAKCFWLTLGLSLALQGLTPPVPAKGTGRVPGVVQAAPEGAGA